MEKSPSAGTRQRVRRALRRLALTPAQTERVARVLRDELGRLEAARALLAECRRELRHVLARPEIDSAAVLELTLQERVLEGRERELAARLDRSLAALLRPEQASRLRGLGPTTLGGVLARLSP